MATNKEAHGLTEATESGETPTSAAITDMLLYIHECGANRETRLPSPFIDGWHNNTIKEPLSAHSSFLDQTCTWLLVTRDSNRVAKCVTQQ